MSPRFAFALSVILAVNTAVAVVGEHPWSGPTLYGVGDSHGVHLADVGMVLAAVVAIIALWRRVVAADD